MAKQITWISEKEAAEKVKRHPRYLRSVVKSGAWTVSYRTVNGKNFEYDEKALENIKNKNAVIVH